MTFDYIPKGVCARKFTIQVEDGVIQSVKAEGGCNGNLQGVAALPWEDYIPRDGEFPVKGYSPCCGA
mgnify:FL=1